MPLRISEQRYLPLNINIAIDPVIFGFGMFHFRWYTLAIMIAIGVALWFTVREFRRKGIDDSNFGNIAIWTIASGVVGARLFHILDRLGFYLDNPGQILDFMSGGLAIYGAVLGGFVGLMIAARIYNVPFLRSIDAIAPGLVLGQGIGRFGCIANGDAWGAPTDSPLSFTYTNPDSFIPNRLLGVATHPYPLYDMALNFAIFGLLLWLRKERLPNGALFAIFVMTYAVGRFFISFVREERVWFWGLQEAQVIAVAALASAVVALVYLLRRPTAYGEKLSPDAA